MPLEFWRAAREAVRAVNPAAIWLAETVHQSFGCLARYRGVRSELDYDMYEAFDLEYEYDIREAFDKYLQGKIVLSHYLDMLNFQEAIYPANYNKLRFLENHDQPRICSYVKDEAALQNYTAMLYFLKGTTLLYAGQEFENDHLPSLFEKEPIDRQTGKDLTPLLKALASIKRALGVPAVVLWACSACRQKAPGSASLPQTARMRTFWTAAPSRSKPAASTAMARL